MSHRTQVICGWLNKEKSSDLFSMLGSWNKRYFTFDGTQLHYYQDEDGINFMGPSGSIHVKYVDFLLKLGGLPWFGYVVLDALDFSSVLFAAIGGCRLHTLSLAVSVSSMHFVCLFDRVVRYWKRSDLSPLSIHHPCICFALSCLVWYGISKPQRHSRR